MKNILFVSVHPIHYNDFLFSEIAAAGMDIQVFYSNKSLKNYPWKQKTNYDFKARDCNYFLKMDWGLLGKVVRGRDTLFIVAGWESLFKNVLFFALMLFRRKYIVWTDTVKVDRPRNRVKAFVRNGWLQSILGHAYRIFTTGEVGVAQMKRLYTKDDAKIVNFPFATDLSYFNTRPDFSGYPALKKVFSSGRLLNFHKGHDLAIRALGQMKKEGWKFEYRIAGTGPDEAMLRALIKEMDLEGEVHLLGWQELEAVRGHYANAHVLLHPSHFDPFPNAILEAMASGLVVAASDKAGSAVERIRDGKSGFIFPDNDLEQLTALLRRIFSTPASSMESISQEALAVAGKWNVDYNIAIVKDMLQTP